MASNPAALMPTNWAVWSKPVHEPVVKSCSRVPTAMTTSASAASAFADWQPVTPTGPALSGWALTNVAFPGAIDTSTRGINPQGQIVGTFDLPDGSFHGLIDRGAGLEQFDVPGGFDPSGYQINARGDVVGDYLDADGNSHGFLWSRTGGR